MSATTATATQPEQRTVALSQVHVADGFNPRDAAEKAEIARLAESIKTHGLIQPLVVCSIDGNGEYRLIDGERRYHACAQASVMEVPVIVRAPDETTGALDVALVANAQRLDLNVVEEAKAFGRLVESGLTRKGVAETLGVSQKLVRDRLALLDLDEALHPQLADGTIPPGAVKSLLELAHIHPALPALAVRRIVEQPEDPNGWGEALTWSDVAHDPIGFVATDYVVDGFELPDGIYEANTTYPLERFSLDEKTTRKLEQLGELLGVACIATLAFRRPDVDAAEKLGVAYRSKNGYGALIVGQDVAEQLVADQVTRTLKSAKAQRKEAEAAAVAGSGDPASDRGVSPAGGGQAPVDEQAAAEERRSEREAQLEARRKAVAFNDELGAAVVNHLARVKVDTRVVKILAAVDFGGDLDKIAMRGARYGMPGFESSEERKSGTKRTYLGSREAHAQAQAFVANAGKNPGDVAGRLIALAVMARYADENAVAQSSRSFASLDGGMALPWSEDTVLLLDEIVGEVLPEHLLEPGREGRDAQAEYRRERVATREWLTAQTTAIETMDTEARAAVIVEATERFGEYSDPAFTLKQRIRELEDAVDADRAENPGGDA